MSLMLGFGLGVTSLRALGFVSSSPTATLASGEWVLEEADVGDTGTTSGVERGPVTLATDTGRMRARFLRPSAVTGSEWGVYFGSSGLTPLDVGATVAAASSQAVGAGAGSLELLRNPRMTDPTRAQALYRAVAGEGDWTVASTAKEISPTTRTTALIEADWTLVVAVIDGDIVVYLDVSDEVDPPVLAGSDFVAFSTLSDPSPAIDADWTTATLTALSGGVLAWVLPGLDTPGATVSNLRVIHQVAGLKTSNFSNVYPAFDLPDVPASFVGGQATLEDAEADGGLQLKLDIVALPDSGGTPLTALEYQTSLDDVTYGATVEIAPTLGARIVTTTADATNTYVRLRAKNALGSSASWLVLGPATSSDGAAEAAELVMSPSRTTLPVGAAVHFEPDMDSLAALASAWSVAGGADELLHNGYFLTTFSADGDEDYTFERGGIVPRGRAWTAGSAIGAWIAHQYRKVGSHAPTTTLYYGANSATWTGALTVQALDTVYAAATNIRVLSTANDFTGLPAAYSTSTQMTSFADAVAWLAGATGRCLLLKGGETLTWTDAMGRLDMPSGSYLGTWNGTRATINMSADIETIARLDLRVAATADQTVFSFSAMPSRTTRSVFVGDALADPSDYTFSGDNPAQPTSLTFDTGVAEGVVVRVVGNMGTAESPVILAQTRALIRMRNTNDATVVNLDFRGDYDQASPITFDGVDYSTFEHTQNIIPFNREPGNTNVTIAQCSQAGLHAFNVDNAGTSSSNAMFIMDCYSQDWRNYGFFPGDHQRDCMVGCTLVGNFAGVTGGSKTFSGVGVSNAVAHGGVRWSTNNKSAVHHNISGSFASWSSVPQPVYRLAQKTVDNQSYNFSENEAWHGTNVSAGGGAGANGDLPSPIGSVFLSEGNLHIFGEESDIGANTPQFFRSRNNIWVVPDLALRNSVLAIYGRDTSGDKWFNGGAIQTPQIYSDTIFIEDSRTSTLYLSGVQHLQSAGLSGVKGNTYTATGSETSITITGNSAQEPSYGFGSTWRLWRSQDGGVTWVEIGQADDTRRVTLAPPGPRNAPGKEWVHPGTGAGILDGWTITFLAQGNMTVDFDSLVLAAGEQVRMTWNPTLDRLGVTFYPNNIPAVIGRLPGVVENTALIVDGTFSGDIVDREGFTTVDPTTVTTAASGPFTADFIPASGSDYFQTATTGRVALRDFMRAVRSSPSKGALEPGTDISGWTIPRTLPTFDWTDAFEAGATVDADSIEVTAGSDASLVVVSKAITVTRGGSPLAPASSYTVAADDVLTASVVYGHVLTGRRTFTLDPQTVAAAAGYTPAIIRNGPSTGGDGNAVMQWSGVSAASAITDPIHVACRFHAVALADGSNGELVFQSAWGVRLSVGGRILMRSSAGTLVNDAGVLYPVGSPKSYLFTWWPGATGPGGLGYRIIEDGVTIASGTTSPGASMSLQSVIFGSINNTAGATTPNLVLEGGIGVWTGGAADYSTFFEADDSPRDYATVSLSGMNGQFIFRDLADFNDLVNRGSGSDAGFPTKDGTFTS